MSEFEVLRLLGEVFGVIAVLLGAMRYVAKLVMGLHARLNHLDECLDDLKKDMKPIPPIVSRHDAEISWLKGKIGEPLERK